MDNDDMLSDIGQWISDVDLDNGFSQPLLAIENTLHRFLMGTSEIRPVLTSNSVSVDGPIRVNNVDHHVRFSSHVIVPASDVDVVNQVGHEPVQAEELLGDRLTLCGLQKRCRDPNNDYDDDNNIEGDVDATDEAIEENCEDYDENCEEDDDEECEEDEQVEECDDDDDDEDDNDAEEEENDEDCEDDNDCDENTASKIGAKCFLKLRPCREPPEEEEIFDDNYPRRNQKPCRDIDQKLQKDNENDSNGGKSNSDKSNNKNSELGKKSFGEVMNIDELHRGSVHISKDELEEICRKYNNYDQKSRGKKTKHESIVKAKNLSNKAGKVKSKQKKEVTVCKTSVYECDDEDFEDDIEAETNKKEEILNGDDNCQQDNEVIDDKYNRVDDDDGCRVEKVEDDEDDDDDEQGKDYFGLERPCHAAPIIEEKTDCVKKASPEATLRDYSCYDKKTPGEKRKTIFCKTSAKYSPLTKETDTYTDITPKSVFGPKIKHSKSSPEQTKKLSGSNCNLIPPSDAQYYGQTLKTAGNVNNIGKNSLEKKKPNQTITNDSIYYNSVNYNNTAKAKKSLEIDNFVKNEVIDCNNNNPVDHDVENGDYYNREGESDIVDDVGGGECGEVTESGDYTGSCFAKEAPEVLVNAETYIVKNIMKEKRIQLENNNLIVSDCSWCNEETEASCSKDSGGEESYLTNEKSQIKYTNYGVGGIEEADDSYFGSNAYIQCMPRETCTSPNALSRKSNISELLLKEAESNYLSMNQDNLYQPLGVYDPAGNSSNFSSNVSITNVNFEHYKRMFESLKHRAFDEEYENYFETKDVDITETKDINIAETKDDNIPENCNHANSSNKSLPQVISGMSEIDSDLEKKSDEKKGGFLKSILGLLTTSGAKLIQKTSKVNDKTDSQDLSEKTSDKFKLPDKRHFTFGRYKVKSTEKYMGNIDIFASRKAKKKHDGKPKIRIGKALTLPIQSKLSGEAMCKTVECGCNHGFRVTKINSWSQENINSELLVKNEVPFENINANTVKSIVETCVDKVKNLMQSTDDSRNTVTSANKRSSDVMRDIVASVENSNFEIAKSTETFVDKNKKDIVDIKAACDENMNSDINNLATSVKNMNTLVATKENNSKCGIGGNVVPFVNFNNHKAETTASSKSINSVAYETEEESIVKSNNSRVNVPGEKEADVDDVESLKNNICKLKSLTNNSSTAVADIEDILEKVQHILEENQSLALQTSKTTTGDFCCHKHPADIFVYRDEGSAVEDNNSLGDSNVETVDEIFNKNVYQEKSNLPLGDTFTTSVEEMKSKKHEKNQLSLLNNKDVSHPLRSLDGHNKTDIITTISDLCGKIERSGVATFTSLDEYQKSCRKLIQRREIANRRELHLRKSNHDNCKSKTAKDNEIIQQSNTGSDNINTLTLKETTCNTDHTYKLNPFYKVSKENNTKSNVPSFDSKFLIKARGNLKFMKMHKEKHNKLNSQKDITKIVKKHVFNYGKINKNDLRKSSALDSSTIFTTPSIPMEMFVSPTHTEEAHVYQNYADSKLKNSTSSFSKTNNLALFDTNKCNTYKNNITFTKNENNKKILPVETVNNPNYKLKVYHPSIIKQIRKEGNKSMSLVNDAEITSNNRSKAKKKQINNIAIEQSYDIINNNKQDKHLRRNNDFTVNIGDQPHDNKHKPSTGLRSFIHITGSEDRGALNFVFNTVKKKKMSARLSDNENANANCGCDDETSASYKLQNVGDGLVVDQQDPTRKILNVQERSPTNSVKTIPNHEDTTNKLCMENFISERCAKSEITSSLVSYDHQSPKTTTICRLDEIQDRFIPQTELIIPTTQMVIPNNENFIEVDNDIKVIAPGNTLFEKNFERKPSTDHIKNPSKKRDDTSMEAANAYSKKNESPTHKENDKDVFDKLPDGGIGLTNLCSCQFSNNELIQETPAINKPARNTRFWTCSPKYRINEAGDTDETPNISQYAKYNNVDISSKTERLQNMHESGGNYIANDEVQIFFGGPYSGSAKYSPWLKEVDCDRAESGDRDKGGNYQFVSDVYTTGKIKAEDINAVKFNADKGGITYSDEASMYSQRNIEGMWTNCNYVRNESDKQRCDDLYSPGIVPGNLWKLDAKEQIKAESSRDTDCWTSSIYSAVKKAFEKKAPVDQRDSNQVWSKSLTSPLSKDVRIWNMADAIFDRRTEETSNGTNCQIQNSSSPSSRNLKLLPMANTISEKGDIKTSEREGTSPTIISEITYNIEQTDNSKRKEYVRERSKSQIRSSSGGGDKINMVRSLSMDKKDQVMENNLKSFPNLEEKLKKVMDNEASIRGDVWTKGSYRVPTLIGRKLSILGSSRRNAVNNLIKIDGDNTGKTNATNMYDDVKKSSPTEIKKKTFSPSENMKKTPSPIGVKTKMYSQSGYKKRLKDDVATWSSANEIEFQQEIISSNYLNLKQVQKEKLNTYRTGIADTKPENIFTMASPKAVVRRLETRPGSAGVFWQKVPQNVAFENNIVNVGMFQNEKSETFGKGDNWQSPIRNLWSNRFSNQGHVLIPTAGKNAQERFIELTSNNKDKVLTDAKKSEKDNKDTINEPIKERKEPVSFKVSNKNESSGRQGFQLVPTYAPTAAELAAAQLKLAKKKMLKRDRKDGKSRGGSKSSKASKKNELVGNNDYVIVANSVKHVLNTAPSSGNERSAKTEKALKLIKMQEISKAKYKDDNNSSQGYVILPNPSKKAGDSTIEKSQSDKWNEWKEKASNRTFRQSLSPKRSVKNEADTRRKYLMIPSVTKMNPSKSADMSLVWSNNKWKLIHGAAGGDKYITNLNRTKNISKSGTASSPIAIGIKNTGDRRFYAEDSHKHAVVRESVKKPDPVMSTNNELDPVISENNGANCKKKFSRTDSGLEFKVSRQPTAEFKVSKQPSGTKGNMEVMAGRQPCAGKINMDAKVIKQPSATTANMEIQVCRQPWVTKEIMVVVSGQPSSTTKNGDEAIKTSRQPSANTENTEVNVSGQPSSTTKNENGAIKTSRQLSANTENTEVNVSKQLNAGEENNHKGVRTLGRPVNQGSRSNSNMNQEYPSKNTRVFAVTAEKFPHLAEVKRVGNNTLLVLQRGKANFSPEKSGIEYQDNDGIDTFQEMNATQETNTRLSSMDREINTLDDTKFESFDKQEVMSIFHLTAGIIDEKAEEQNPIWDIVNNKITDKMDEQINSSMEINSNRLTEDQTFGNNGALVNVDLRQINDQELTSRTINSCLPKDGGEIVQEMYQSVKNKARNRESFLENSKYINKMSYKDYQNFVLKNKKNKNLENGAGETVFQNNETNSSQKPLMAKEVNDKYSFMKSNHNLDKNMSSHESMNLREQVNKDAILAGLETTPAKMNSKHETRNNLDSIVGGNDDRLNYDKRFMIENSSTLKYNGSKTDRLPTDETYSRFAANLKVNTKNDFVDTRNFNTSKSLPYQQLMRPSLAIEKVNNGGEMKQMTAVCHIRDSASNGRHRNEANIIDSSYLHISNTDRSPSSYKMNAEQVVEETNHLKSSNGFSIHSNMGQNISGYKSEESTSKNKSKYEMAQNFSLEINESELINVNNASRSMRKESYDLIGDSNLLEVDTDQRYPINERIRNEQLASNVTAEETEITLQNELGKQSSQYSHYYSTGHVTDRSTNQIQIEACSLNQTFADGDVNSYSSPVATSAAVYTDHRYVDTTPVRDYIKYHNQSLSKVVPSTSIETSDSNFGLETVKQNNNQYGGKCSEDHSSSKVDTSPTPFLNGETVNVSRFDSHQNKSGLNVGKTNDTQLFPNISLSSSDKHRAKASNTVLSEIDKYQNMHDKKNTNMINKHSEQFRKPNNGFKNNHNEIISELDPRKVSSTVHKQKSSNINESNGKKDYNSLSATKEISVNHNATKTPKIDYEEKLNNKNRLKSSGINKNEIIYGNEFIRVNGSSKKTVSKHNNQLIENHDDEISVKSKTERNQYKLTPRELERKVGRDSKWIEENFKPEITSKDFFRNFHLIGDAENKKSNNVDSKDSGKKLKVETYNKKSHNVNEKMSGDKLSPSFDEQRKTGNISNRKSTQLNAVEDKYEGVKRKQPEAITVASNIVDVKVGNRSKNGRENTKQDNNFQKLPAKDSPELYTSCKHEAFDSSNIAPPKQSLESSQIKQKGDISNRRSYVQKSAENNQLDHFGVSLIDSSLVDNVARAWNEDTRKKSTFRENLAAQFSFVNQRPNAVASLHSPDATGVNSKSRLQTSSMNNTRHYLDLFPYPTFLRKPVRSDTISPGRGGVKAVTTVRHGKGSQLQSTQGSNHGGLHVDGAKGSTNNREGNKDTNQDISNLGKSISKSLENSVAETVSTKSRTAVANMQERITTNLKKGMTKDDSFINKGHVYNDIARAFRSKSGDKEMTSNKNLGSVTSETSQLIQDKSKKYQALHGSLEEQWRSKLNREIFERRSTFREQKITDLKHVKTTSENAQAKRQKSESGKAVKTSKKNAVKSGKTYETVNSIKTSVDNTIAKHNKTSGNNQHNKEMSEGSKINKATESANVSKSQHDNQIPRGQMLSYRVSRNGSRSEIIKSTLKGHQLAIKPETSYTEISKITQKAEVVDEQKLDISKEILPEVKVEPERHESAQEPAPLGLFTRLLNALTRSSRGSSTPTARTAENLDQKLVVENKAGECLNEPLKTENVQNVKEKTEAVKSKPLRTRSPHMTTKDS